MNSRKAFTLIELLVVMAIILVLMGILLPVLSHMRRSAQITGQKADFVTISNALEAYKGDFGDYPRNNILTSWNVSGNALAAPIRLSLAAALIGPGPQVTQGPGGTGTNIGQYEIGDGADGLGFRAQTTNYAVTVSGISLTASPETITLSNPPPQLGSFVPGQTPGSITMSIGTIYEETVGFVVDSTTPGQLDLMAGAMYPSNHATTDKYLIKVGSTKIFPNYLPADTFKVAFVPTTAGGAPGGGGGIGPAGDAVLLDRWGQVIQYFPRYGQPSNRTNDSLMPANASVQAGPLYGYSQPKSIDATYGQNAIWDLRDGEPLFSVPVGSSTWVNPVTGNTDNCQTWPPAGAVSTSNLFRPDWTIQWMLGEQIPPGSSGGTVFDDVIEAPEKLNWDGPFILISAGPDGPERLYGGYCNFANQTTGDMSDPNSGNANVLTPAQLLQMFTNSGNIFNFDHP